MIDDTNSSDSSQKFLSDVERLLSPLYAECFSDETRKVRNHLLIVSFVLILSALGLIAISRDPVKVPTLEITVTITSGLRYILITLCSYFLLLHSMRSYAEWKIWRLRHQAPLSEFLDYLELISSQLREHFTSINALYTSSIELVSKLAEPEQEPPGLVDDRKRLADLFEEGNRVLHRLLSKRSQLQYDEVQDEFSKLDQLHKEANRLNHELDRQRDEHRARINAEQDAGLRQLEDLKKTLCLMEGAPELKRLEAMSQYLVETSQQVRTILHFRFSFEVLFPTVFALAAIVIGIFAK